MSFCNKIAFAVFQCVLNRSCGLCVCTFNGDSYKRALGGPIKFFHHELFS